MEETTKENYQKHKIANIVVSIIGLVFLFSFGFIVFNAGKFNTLKQDIIAQRSNRNNSIVTANEVNNQTTDNTSSVAGIETESEQISNNSDIITTTKQPEPKKTVVIKEYTETAVSGNGVTTLARKALNSYLQDNSVSLPVENKLYVEVTMTNDSKPFTIRVGDVRVFTAAKIAEIIQNSNILSSYQLDAWKKQATISNYH
ncbi:MAG: hypothetical protein ABIM99_04160 [Candidatus Dojkabacteria bacterium]